MSSIATVNKTKKIEKLSEAIDRATLSMRSLDKIEDSGSCNLDTVVIKLKNWRLADIIKLNELSSIKLDREPLGAHMWRGYRVVNFKVDGQAMRRSAQIQSAFKVLSAECSRIFPHDECIVDIIYQAD